MAFDAIRFLSLSLCVSHKDWKEIWNHFIWKIDTVVYFYGFFSNTQHINLSLKKCIVRWSYKVRLHSIVQSIYWTNWYKMILLCTFNVFSLFHSSPSLPIFNSIFAHSSEMCIFIYVRSIRYLNCKCTISYFATATVNI